MMVMFSPLTHTNFIELIRCIFKCMISKELQKMDHLRITHYLGINDSTTLEFGVPGVNVHPLFFAIFAKKRPNSTLNFVFFHGAFV